MGNWETYCESIQQDMLFSPKDFSVWSAESPCCTREVKKTSLKKSRKAEPTKAHVTPVRLVQDLERGSSIQRLITVITWQASKVRMCLRFLVWLWLILEKVDMKRECNFGTSHNTYFKGICSGFRSFEGQKMCLSQMTAIWRPSGAVLRCRREPFFVRMALQDTPRKKGVKSVWPRDVRYVGKGEWQEEYRGAWGARRIFQSSYFIWSARSHPVIRQFSPTIFAALSCWSL